MVAGATAIRHLGIFNAWHDFSGGIARLHFSAGIHFLVDQLGVGGEAMPGSGLAGSHGCGLLSAARTRPRCSRALCLCSRSRAARLILIKAKSARHLQPLHIASLRARAGVPALVALRAQCSAASGHGSVTDCRQKRGRLRLLEEIAPNPRRGLCRVGHKTPSTVAAIAAVKI
jgi:hypothetical protein